MSWGPVATKMARWSELLVDLPAHARQLSQAMQTGNMAKANTLYKLTLVSLGLVGKGMGLDMASRYIQRASDEV